MCIHSEDAPQVSPKAQAKLAVSRSKQYVKDLTKQLRDATKELAKKNREFQAI